MQREDGDECEREQVRGKLTHSGAVGCGGFMTRVLLPFLLLSGASSWADDVSPVQAKLAALEAAQQRRHQIFAAGKGTLADEAERAAVQALGEQAAGAGEDPVLNALYVEKVIPLVIHSLDAEPGVRRSAIVALRKMGTPAVAPLVAALQQRDDEALRGGAAEALGELRPAESVPVLTACLHDEDRWVRNRCGYALTCAAEIHPQARASVLESLGDGDVVDGVRDFMNENPGELERLAPEIPRALEALEKADPLTQVVRWLFRSSIAVAVISFLAFALGMIRLIKSGKGKVVSTGNEPILKSSRHAGRSQFQASFAVAKSKGRSWSYADSMDISDLVEGMKASDPAAINFGQRALGLLFFVLFAFLAIGFGMVDAGESAGWGFVGFVGLFFGLIAQQTALSYSLRKKRVRLVGP